MKLTPEQSDATCNVVAGSAFVSSWLTMIIIDHAIIGFFFAFIVAIFWGVVTDNVIRAFYNKE